MTATLVLSACRASKELSAAKQDCPNNFSLKVLAVAFQQHAAEYKALCYQAYNIASDRLKAYEGKNTSKPLAVITDIDETVLDNSQYAAHQLLEGRDYESTSWHEWAQKGTADTVPGALTFFNLVAEKGISVFYITNRSEEDKLPTIRNLQRFNFPFADSEHLFTRSTEGSKQGRREAVLQTYDVILYLGDNLSDFTSIFDNATQEARNGATDAMRSSLGEKFVILPNTTYGDWEHALLDSTNPTSVFQEDSIIREKLRAY